jgi:hypothetical protein
LIRWCDDDESSPSNFGLLAGAHSRLRIPVTGLRIPVTGIDHLDAASFR